MMTESYEETIRCKGGSPYDCPVLTAELVLGRFEPAAVLESRAVISNLPEDGETGTVTDVEGFGKRARRRLGETNA